MQWSDFDRGTHSSSLCLCDSTMVAAAFPLLGTRGEMLGGGVPEWNVRQGEKAPNPSEKFLRDSDVANINIFSSKKRGSLKAVCKMAQWLLMDSWHEPQQALAGLKSTSVSRSSHHLQEKQTENDVKDLKTLSLLYKSRKRVSCF